MATYGELMELRRMALKKDPPDEALAQELFEVAQELIDSGEASEDEILGAQY